MARLPVDGGDPGNWGAILNGFLLIEHNSDGTLRSSGSLAAKADDSSVVHVSGSETITGAKTFSANPTVPTPTAGGHATTKTYVDTAISGASAPDATTISKGIVQLAGDLSGTASAPTVPGLASKESTITAGTIAQYWRGDKTFQTLNKAAVGLGNVDNTSDINKPISTAAQTALDAKVDEVTLTTKGDIYVATAASTPARLAAGTNGQYLQAASGATTGLQWAGIDDPLAAMHGLSMMTMHPGVAINSHTLASGTAVFVLIRSTKPQQINTLGVWMHGAGSGPNGVNGMAIYTEAGVLMEKTGTMVFNAAGYIEGTLASTQTLTIGTYYIGVLTHNTSIPAIQSSNLNIVIPAFTTHYPSIFFTGLTDFAVSFNPATAGANDSTYVMGAR